jgi:hypothetical protein
MMVLCGGLSGTAAFGAREAPRIFREARPIAQTKKDLELPVPLSSYLTPPSTKFRTWVSTKAATPTASNPQKQKVITTSNCTGGAKYATVTVTALDASHTIGHRGEYDRSPNGYATLNGFALAKIDVSGCDYDFIGLKNGHTAYLVVALDPNHNFAAHIIDVTGTTDVDLTYGHWWTFAECPEQHNINTDIGDVLTRDFVCQAHYLALVPDKDRKKPNRPLDSIVVEGKVAAFLETQINPFASRGGADGDPLVWIVCADGCCYIDQIR